MKTVIFLAMLNVVFCNNKLTNDPSQELLPATVEAFLITNGQAIVDFSTAENDLSDYEFATTQLLKFTQTDGGSTVDVEMTVASYQMNGGDVTMNFNLPSGGLSGLEIVGTQQIIVEELIMH